MHLALTKQLPNLDFPALPHVTNTASSSKLEEQRIELEKYLNRITKISESWSCPVFGSFFCVQTDLSAAELTAGIVGRILTLGQENIILSDQLKATNSALLEATAHIQQLESRLALLEHGGVGSARASNSRSGSVSIAGERGSDGALPVLYGASKAKHRLIFLIFVYISS